MPNPNRIISNYQFKFTEIREDFKRKRYHWRVLDQQRKGQPSTTVNTFGFITSSTHFTGFRNPNLVRTQLYQTTTKELRI